MNKLKNVLVCVGITSLMWAIARFIPGVIVALFPDSSTAQMIALIAFLPLGWIAAKGVSKGTHATCIRANLYVFAVIEILGIFSVITYLLQNLSFYTGRYSTDAYGLPYSEYGNVFSIVIAFEILYVSLCFFFAKKTTDVTQNDDLSCPIDPDANTCSNNIQQSVNSIPISVRQKKTKLRFCKYCGRPIDPNTKKCTGCSKQYFRLPDWKRHRSLLVAATVTTLAVIITCLSVSRISQLEAAMASKDLTIEQLQHQISDENQKYNELLVSQAETEEKINFYEQYIVFIINDGTNRYHKYDCSVFENRRKPFWVYTIANAKYEGYSPCVICCK